MAASKETDSGWFAWAVPSTTSTGATEADAGRPPADVATQPPAERPSGETAEAHPLHADVHDLKLSHSMTRAMVTSHTDQLNARMDKELASHSKAIGELKSRLYGGAGEPSVMEDVQMIIDVMRRDINSQRELLMMVNENIPALRENITALRKDVDTNMGSGPSGGTKGGLANMSGYVTLQQHEQVFGALQEQMRTLHKATELSAVKAGFLAVASTECSLEERKRLFDTLKAKEEAIQRGEEQYALATDQGGMESAYKRRVADGGRPMTTAPGNPQGGAEFTVRVDKSAGDPLGIQIDHEDGSSLLIDAVHDGLIKSWNKVNPGLAVYPEDRIVAVNGKRGNAELLLRETEQKQVLTLAVMRSR